MDVVHGIKDIPKMKCKNIHTLVTHVIQSNTAFIIAAGGVIREGITLRHVSDCFGPLIKNNSQNIKNTYYNYCISVLVMGRIVVDSELQ